MSFYEVLEQIGANRPLLFARFGNQENLALHFYRAFLEEASFSGFQSAYEKGDMENALCSLHQLQGLSGNLSMDELMRRCQSGVSQLRKVQTLAQEEYQSICEEYARVCGLIRQMD